MFGRWSVGAGERGQVRVVVRVKYLIISHGAGGAGKIITTLWYHDETRNIQINLAFSLVCTTFVLKLTKQKKYHESERKSKKRGLC